MKKMIAFVMVCGFALAMVSCGGKKAETATDSTANAVADTIVAKTDSIVKQDSVAK